MIRSRMVDAFIFDLDGTLADTFGLIVSAWNAAVSPHTGRSYSAQEVISRFGIPDEQMIRRELPGPAGEQAVEVYHKHYAAHHEMVTVFAGINELLRELRRRQVPLGVMTGKGRRSAHITLKALGWDQIFAAVVTGDDVERQKPFPDGPLLAARRLDVAPAECAFVGDSPADIGAAKNAGMLCVAAAWHGHYREKIKSMNPDVWAETPADLLKLIKSPTEANNR